MRPIMMTIWTIPVAMLLGPQTATSRDRAVAEEPAAVQSAQEPAEKADTVAAAAEEKAEEIRIPPGFHKKQRGKYVVYCRKEAVMGTRFEQEKCYDENGLREYEATLRENQEKVDQMRRICSSMEYCGAN